MRSPGAAAPLVELKVRGQPKKYMVGMDPRSRNPVIIDTEGSRVVTSGFEKSVVMSAFFKMMKK